MENTANILAQPAALNGKHTHKTMQFCSFSELCWGVTCSGSQVLTHRSCELQQEMWNTKFPQKKNFFPNRHPREKAGSHLGWLMDLWVSSLQDKRKKCIRPSEDQKPFLCTVWIKNHPTLRGPLTPFSSFCPGSLSPFLLLGLKFGIFSSLLWHFLGHWVALLVSYLLLLCWGVGMGCWDFENSHGTITEREMEWRPKCGKQFLVSPGQFKAGMGWVGLWLGRELVSN